MTTTKKSKLLFLVISILFIFPQCKVVRLGLFLTSDYHAKPSFDTKVVQHNPTDVFEFARADSSTHQELANLNKPFRIRPKKEWVSMKMQLENFLRDETETTAIVVIQNDTIMYEQYFQGYDANSILPSFSIAKSFTSALLGITISEGHITSIHDPITQYIPELQIQGAYWNELTIEHLLNMRSGLGFKETDFSLPYYGVADLYDGKNALKVIQRAEFIHRPGVHFSYSSLDNQLLGLVLQRATGKDLATLLEEKIWTKIGMHHNATWDMDSKKHQITKSYCCMKATALDYARFARLYLNGGKWNGEQIIPADWVTASTQVNYPDNDYQYQWWLSDYKISDGFTDSLTAVANNSNPQQQYIQQSKKDKLWYIHKAGPSYQANGAFGQYLYIDPYSNTIILRLGKKQKLSLNSLTGNIIRYLNYRAHRMRFAENG